MTRVRTKAGLTATAAIVAVGLTVLTARVAAADPDQPPTAELAKKCRDLAIKAHPPVVVGSAHGEAAAQRAYFAACIKKGGEPDK